MKSKDSIEGSLINSLAIDKIELISEISEIGLDHFITDEFLNEIPMFSIFYKGVKAINGIREAIFIKKIYRFLKEFNSIKDDEKITLISVINNSEKQRIKAGQALIMVIEKLDDLDKTSIIANLFLHYLKSNLNLSEFIHLCSIVQNTYIDILKSFCTIEDTRKLDSEIQGILSSNGLMNPLIMDLKSMYGSSYIIEKNEYLIVYIETKMGSKMRKYALKPVNTSR